MSYRWAAQAFFQRTRDAAKLAMFRALSRESGINPRNVSACTVFVEHRLIFNRIKKSGNSSVLLYLADAIKGANNSNDYIMAKRNAGAMGKSPAQLSMKEMREFRKYTSFTVVRDPIARCLSVYLEKGKSSKSSYTKVPGLAEQTPTGFRRFVSFLEDGGLRTNRHWWPQTELLFLPVSRIDYICRLENLAEDFPVVLAAAGLPAPDRSTLDSPHPMEQSYSGKITGASGRLEQFYDADLVRRVRRIYEIDFRNFGYPLGEPASAALGR